MSDPVSPPVTFPTSGPTGTVLNVFTAGLSSPAALAMNGTILLVADYFNQFTNTYNSAGTQLVPTLDNLNGGILGLAVDVPNGLIYQAFADFTDLAVFDLATTTLLAFVPLPGVPRGLAVQPGTSDLYIALVSQSVVLVLRADGSFGVIENDYFSTCTSVAFSPIDGTLYVGNQFGGGIWHWSTGRYQLDRWHSLRHRLYVRRVCAGLRHWRHCGQCGQCVRRRSRDRPRGSDQLHGLCAGIHLRDRALAMLPPISSSPLTASSSPSTSLSTRAVTISTSRTARQVTWCRWRGWCRRR